MKKEVIVHPEKIKFFVSTIDGYAHQYGYKVSVNGYDFFFHPVMSDSINHREIRVTEFTTGVKMMSFLIGKEEMKRQSNEEGLLKEWHELGKQVAEKIEKVGSDNFEKEVERMRKEVVGKYGEMPKYEVMEEKPWKKLAINVFLLKKLTG